VSQHTVKSLLLACSLPAVLFLPALGLYPASVATAQRAECAVAGTARFALDVPLGTGSMRIDLLGVDATACPPTEDGPSSIEVRGVIAFSGAASDVPYRPRAPTDLAGGIVRLGEWAMLSQVRARGARALVTADIGDGIHLRRLRMPCASLTIAPIPRQRQPPPEPECRDVRYSTAARPTGARRIVFRARPGAGPAVTAELSGDRDLILCETARSNDWVRVATTDTVHLLATLRGWVPRADLRPLPDGVGFTGGSLTPANFPPGGVGRVAGPGVYNGPARLTVGTRVHSAPDGLPWATVIDGQAEVVVVAIDGEPWVRLTEIPGLGPVDAWVPRIAVRVP
jgi:hypothetical protein